MPARMSATEGPSPTMHKLMQRLSTQKRVDMSVSIDITSLANCRVRDTNGNILATVWTRRSINNEYDNATLLTRDALQKHLQAFLEKNIESNSEMLVKLSDPTLLVDWVVRTSEQWEHRYALKRDEKFDISHGVESAMSQVVIEHALPYLKHHQEFDAIAKKLEANMKTLVHEPTSNRWARALLKHISQDRAASEDQRDEMFFWLYRGNHALTRLLFRLDTSTELRDRLCLLAAKLHQKKEVCERQGVYSSVRQRSDIVQLYNNTVLAFRDFVQRLPRKTLLEEAMKALSADTWIFLVIDHTAVPVTMADVQPPAPHGGAGDAHSECPTCGAAFVPAAHPKRHRA
jgi:hypothetical protein